MEGQGQLGLLMNTLALHSLPETSAGFRGVLRDRFELVRESGFDGIQFADPATEEELTLCQAMKFVVCGSGRVNEPGDAERLGRQFADAGYACSTLHVGWGLEEDDEAARLIESILESSVRWRVPLYFETHRATICQDIWRTVHFVQRFPEMRFNADFSHWYTGQEMVYGGFDRKLAFIQPVIARVEFVHGRIANPGCIQVPWNEDATYVKHFETLWSQCFRAFLRSPSSEYRRIYFAPELLSSDIYYARSFQGSEESDRWTESLRLKNMAEHCFACAR